MTTNPLRRERHCNAPQEVVTGHPDRMQMRCDIQTCRRCNTTNHHLFVFNSSTLARLFVKQEDSHSLDQPEFLSMGAASISHQCDSVVQLILLPTAVGLPVDACSIRVRVQPWQVA